MNTGLFEFGQANPNMLFNSWYKFNTNLVKKKKNRKYYVNDIEYEQ